MAYAEESARLARKRQLAQALMQQGAQPQGMQAGRMFVGPTTTSSLASLASIIAGGVMDRKLEKKEKTLAEDRRKQLADMLSGLTGRTSPTGLEKPPLDPARMDGAGVISESGAMPGAQTPPLSTGQPPADPQRESMLQFLQGLPIEQQETLVGQQALAKLFPKQPDMKSLFGSVSPDQFTPESLQAFQRTGDYGVLKPRSGQNIGNFNPGDYTPQSFAKFMQSGNATDLVRYVTPANPSVQIVGGVPTVVQPDRTGGAPTQSPLSTLGAEAGAKGTLAGAEAGATAQAKSEIEQGADTAKRSKDFAQTLSLYETARDGLITGLEGSETGPIIGRVPALTAAQQTAAGGVAAMAPVLKQLFRASGEGTFTDRDQALLLQMVPDRTDLPEAREAKIANIDSIVRAKLGIPNPQKEPDSKGNQPSSSKLIRNPDGSFTYKPSP